MRTTGEIIERVKAIEKMGMDWLGTQRTDLIIRLPFEDAKQFLADETSVGDWKIHSRAPEDVKAEMLEYMPFAWDKANDKRGISAGRSMDHFSAWVWLCGDDLGDLTEYQYYGKDNLVKICAHYGWDSSQWDDGVRGNE